MDTIWVGEIDGEALVYDPAIQLLGCPHLFLWIPAEGEMGKYIADLIRKRIKPHSNSSIAATYIESYQHWRNSSGSAWLEDQKNHYTSQRIANLTPAERHKEHLERLGKEYLGVRTATSKQLIRRTTHCYNCKNHLDNSINIECIACGWIICNCGACGCGRR